MFSSAYLNGGDAMIHEPLLTRSNRSEQLSCDVANDLPPSKRCKPAESLSTLSNSTALENSVSRQFDNAIFLDDGAHSILMVNIVTTD